MMTMLDLLVQPHSFIPWLHVGLITALYMSNKMVYVNEIAELTGTGTSYLLTYLLSYLLTPWSRVLPEKLTGSAASQARKFITVLTSARHLSLS